MKCNRKYWLFIIAVVGFVIWLGYMLYVEHTRREIGENLPTVDWLPKTASNVSYFRSYLNKAYEFDISEPEFREWAGWDMKEIEEPVGIRRYLFFIKSVQPPGPKATPEELKAYDDACSELAVKIESGLYYENKQTNGGGLRVGYDRKRGRAFFHSSPR